MSEMLYFAKQYAAAGLAVLPLKQDKSPYTAHGVKDASVDEAVIENWWKKWPSANIGIATGMASGGVFVIDQDEKNGEHGKAVFEDWLEKNDLKPGDTWSGRTASGGRHTFFRASVPVRNRVGWLPGVDVKGDGGYVAVPPSVLSDGSRYEWEVSPFDLENPLSDEDPAVSFTVSEINRKSKKSAVLSMPKKIDRGKRNDSLYRLACSLQAKGLSDAAILAAVQAENTAKCNPPLDDSEIRGIIQSAFSRVKGSPTTDDSSPDLDRFHIRNEEGKITGVFDYEIHRYLKETTPLFILGKIPFIYRNGVYRPDTSGAQLKTMIRKLIYPQYVKSATLTRIHDLFISDAELERTYEDLNRYPPEWICFRNGFYDPVNRKMVPHDPKYFATNQVPHDFDSDAKPEGELIQRWFDFIAESPDDLEMLLQYAGYCLTRDTRQQKFLILRGEGGSGKSTVIRLIEKMIGAENISSISLKQLNQRFAPFSLLGKLLNSCADLEVTALEDVSTLKKILGEDSISGEAKNKDMISFRSYAKLIFSTNELPIVKAERTNGFYRRLLVLKMDKLPEDRNADFFQQLSKEIVYFIHACVDALSRMYEAGTITESEGSKEEVLRLRCDSDTVEAYMKERIIIDPDGYVLRSKLFDDYSRYCQETERQALNRNNFFRAVRTRGIGERKINIGTQRGMSVFSGISFLDAVSEPSGEGFMSTEGIEVPFLSEEGAVKSG